MARYGMVMDHRKCIGCHLCSVVCKSENDVPLGVFRTWVKYVEKGTFPDVRRYFMIMRCNHCEAAPCVTVCPTMAMHRRPDGIVDIDSSRCIGCKACMAACPYDAIYIDPNTHTASKCTWCSHRVDLGLQPACVVMCPAQAFTFGDLDDPESEISQLLSSTPYRVRRPEAGTRPKTFYIGVDETTASPTAAAVSPVGIWSQQAVHKEGE